MVICVIHGVEETALQKCGLQNITHFFKTDAARKEIPHFTQEIQLAEQYLADEELDTEEPQQSHQETQDD